VDAGACEEGTMDKKYTSNHFAGLGAGGAMYKWMVGKSMLACMRRMVDSAHLVRKSWMH
jgi:hypothetical protein